MLKGNLLVGQSGGPTPVINASLAGVIQRAAAEKHITGIYGMIHGIEGILSDNLVDLSGISASTIEKLKRTPSSALGSCRHKLAESEYDQIISTLSARNIRHFIYIGGNDSMDTCDRIGRIAQSVGYDLQVMGVPKTIDNDLAETDHTPGFGSAARFFALAVRGTGLDLEAMSTFDDVTILETMGRNAGWLTAASTLGKEGDDDAPHLIQVPERTFNEEVFLEDVARIHSRLGRVFVVVCEGAKDSEGRTVGDTVGGAASAPAVDADTGADTTGEAPGPGRPARVGGRTTDSFGHSLPTLGTGAASWLSNLVRTRLGLQSRFLRPGLIGRTMSGCVSEIDGSEAYTVGGAAVDLLVEGETGLMVSIRRTSEDPYESETDSVPMERAANAERLLPDEYLTPEGTMITDAFRRYATPLIGEPLPEVVRFVRRS